MLPAWAVDELVDHWPVSCDCGHVFSESDRIAVGEPVHHQVEELPVIAVRVIEHRCQRVRCPGCGARRTGLLPSDVAASHLGPRLQAAIATLSVRNRLSRRDAVELVEELFQARVSSGTVDAVLARVGGALADPHQDLLDAVRFSRQLNMDETGWRLRGSQRALWGMFTDEHAYFHVAPDRHEDHAKMLLANTTAIVTSDRWRAYSHLPLARRQICWAHLPRDFTAHAEGLAEEKCFGELGLHVCERLFWAWEVFQHTGDRRALKREVTVLRRELKPALRRFAGKSPRNNTAAAWPEISSRHGPRYGPSPLTLGSSQPTTTPSARYVAPSSIASSASAASPKMARHAPPGCSPHTRPAASNSDRCSSTSPKHSTPTPAATQPHT
jgi:hypothetical protein